MSLPNLHRFAALTTLSLSAAWAGAQPIAVGMPADVTPGDSHFGLLASGQDMSVSLFSPFTAEELALSIEHLAPIKSGPGTAAVDAGKAAVATPVEARPMTRALRRDATGDTCRSLAAAPSAPARTDPGDRAMGTAGRARAGSSPVASIMPRRNGTLAQRLAAAIETLHKPAGGPRHGRGVPADESSMRSAPLHHDAPT